MCYGTDGKVTSLVNAKLHFLQPDTPHSPTPVFKVQTPQMEYKMNYELTQKHNSHRNNHCPQRLYHLSCKKMEYATPNEHLPQMKQLSNIHHWQGT